jgi:hypothetical protein
MMCHVDLSQGHLRNLIKRREITLAGNRNLRIYGTLYCCSGKRMKIANRVFFDNEREAIAEGFRPCGHCLKNSYAKWKTSQEAG